MLAFSGGAETANKTGYFATAIVYSVVSIPLFLLVFKNSKEVVQPSVDMNKVSIGTILKNLVGNKYLMLISVIMLCQMTGLMGRITEHIIFGLAGIGAPVMLSMVAESAQTGQGSCRRSCLSEENCNMEY